MLHTVYNQMPQKKLLKYNKKLRLFFKSDRAILVSCISIAFVFWFFTKLSYVYKSTIKIAVEYNVSTDRVLRNLPPETFEMDFEGSGWDLIFLHFRTRKLLIDLDLSDNLQKKLMSVS